MYKHLGVLCGQKGKWSMLLVVMDKRISIHLPHEVEWLCVFQVQCLSVVGKHCFVISTVYGTLALVDKLSSNDFFHMEATLAILVFPFEKIQ